MQKFICFFLTVLSGSFSNICVFADDTTPTTTSPSSSQIYRWKDAKGEVHFSDTQQPGAEVVTTEPAPAPILNSDLAERNQAIEQQNKDSELNKKLNTEQQVEVQQAKQYQDQLNKVCQQYQDNIKMLTEQAGRRIYTVDPQGQYHYFNEDERVKQLNETQANYQKFCTSGKR